jgi:hypothetical protein
VDQLVRNNRASDHLPEAMPLVQTLRPRVLLEHYEAKLLKTTL